MPAFSICRVVVASAFAAMVFASEVGHAQGIVAGPGTNSGPPLVLPIPESQPGVFDFASPNNRAVVDFSASAGVFVKELFVEPDQNGDGESNLLDVSAFLATATVTLNEHLQVGPSAPWTDWHEQILTPGWQWGSASFTTPNNPGALTNLSTVNSGAAIDFFFDPLPSGTDVDISKQLSFSGTFSQQDIADFVSGNYSIRIAEFPTSVPEPGTALLVGLVACFGSTVYLRRRWDTAAQPAS